MQQPPQREQREDEKPGQAPKDFQLIPSKKMT
jgi:hypothetical protein